MLLEALALVTAEIDFADEAEAPTLVVLPVQAIVNQLAHEFRQALRDSDRAERVKEGFKVVLCGPPNVGKSTLMNTLAQRDVAIVTEHAGTTRDVIQIELDLGGVSVVLSDTAGLRDSIDPVEVIGVARSRQVMANADLLLWLSDGSQALGSDENTERRLVIASKLDDAQDLPEWADLGLSAKTGFGITALVARIELLARAAVAGEMSLVTNARQRRCVEVASRHAERLVTDDTLALEIIADELLRCSRALEELLGPIGVEDILGSVFSRFCMGK